MSDSSFGSLSSRNARDVMAGADIHPSAEPSQGKGSRECPRVEFHWPVWGHVHILAPITTACLSLAEPVHMCAAEQGDPSGHGLRSREGQFFKENLEGIFKSMRIGCWMGRDTWCQLYFPSLYIAELLCFAPRTLERSSGGCIWLTSFKTLPCCGPWASCGGFSPFRSGACSSGLGHWGDYVPLVSVSSPGMVKWPRKSQWDEIRLLLKLEWKRSFFFKINFLSWKLLSSTPRNRSNSKIILRGNPHVPTIQFQHLLTHGQLYYITSHSGLFWSRFSTSNHFIYLFFIKSLKIRALGGKKMIFPTNKEIWEDVGVNVAAAILLPLRGRWLEPIRWGQSRKEERT